ncbi:MAG: TonB-dependent receptor plug domain-containing protein [Acidobacteriota bacterium]
MNHEQEFSEHVEVIYSEPTLDAGRLESSQELGSQEMIKVPAAATRDIRKVLPFVPGLITDAAGGVHINGSTASQVQFLLDGFALENPGTDVFDARISSESIRSLEALTSRYSAEYGKASGGVVRLSSGAPDDHFRFSATDFFPSFQTRNGLHLDNFTPRTALSGPLVKGKAWIYQALEGEFGQDVIEELPEGADTNQRIQFNSLTKVQLNLSRSNILSTSAFVNVHRENHYGLTAFNPQQTTIEKDKDFFLVGVRDQLFLPAGVVEFSGAATRATASDRPMGQEPYEVEYQQSRGNFFKSSTSRADSLEGSASLTVPPERNGGHQVKLGAQATWRGLVGREERRPITMLRDDGRPLRRITYDEFRRVKVGNVELAGFVQDRWWVLQNLSVELGLRFDWDRLLRVPVFSPRFAASVLANPKTKLTVGAGLLCDTTNLSVLAASQYAARSDVFFKDGVESLIHSRFEGDVGQLQPPKALTWSASIERQVGSSLLAGELTQRRAWCYAAD